MITVDFKEIKECYNFALTAWNNKSQSSKQFGTSELRLKNSFIADQTIGKLAEYIFKYTFENLSDDIQVKLNFSHYSDPHHTDEGDVEIIINQDSLALKIDVKGSSHKAQWLLVEMHKYRDLKSKVPISDRYVMVKFSAEVPDSKTLRSNPDLILGFPEIKGEIKGWANHADFSSNKDQSAWFLYHKGQRPYKMKVLPRTSAKVNDIKHLQNYINKIKTINDLSEEDILLNLPLDAKLNVGLPISWLKTDIEKIIEI